MTQFLGTHRNRLDAKGRVSVPASFRAALRSNGNGDSEHANGSAPHGPMLVLRPSHTLPCIEAWPPGVFQTLTARLESLDLFSDAHDDLAAALYADAFPVESDKEGRIIIPEPLIAHARVTDSVVFMGLGRIFQIWEPEAADRRRAEAREHARTRGFTLPSGGRP